MEKRVLIYAPTGQDAVLASKMLTLAGVANLVTDTSTQLAAELLQGVGAVLTVEEALSNGGLKVLGEFAQAIALGMVLIALALLMNGALMILQGDAHTVRGHAC